MINMSVYRPQWGLSSISVMLSVFVNQLMHSQCKFWSPCKLNAFCSAITLLQDIPKELPLLLSRLRAVWNLSPYYGNVEPFTRLLRRISNEIINACVQLSDKDNAVLERPITSARHVQVGCKLHSHVRPSDLANAHQLPSHTRAEKSLQTWR